MAAEPIIWFIASEIALKWSSPSSSSTFVPSPPIIRSVITFTSCSFNTRILLPSSPAVYLIKINTQGLSYSTITLSHLAIWTTGVVIFTFRLTREYSVVADEPILMLATSPMASFSTADSASEFTLLLESVVSCTWLSFASSVKDIPFNNALISSCDSIPSMPYSPSLMTETTCTA